MQHIYLAFSVWVLFLAPYPGIANINVDAAILAQNKQIKQLIDKNKALLSKIEQLEQQQQTSAGKIKELFNLIEYKQSSIAVEKVWLKTQQQNTQAKEIYTSARTLLASNQYNQAIKKLNQYLSTYPNGKYASDAQYWLAKSYLVKEDYGNAEKKFMLFLQKNPHHYKQPNALFELAKIYLKLNKTNNASELLKTILRKFPNHQTAAQAQLLLSKIQPKTSAK